MGLMQDASFIAMPDGHCIKMKNSLIIHIEFADIQRAIARL